ncbi:MAG TPA: DUF3524 domain-containing protein [Desulfobacteraceae bacterium]|nr:DUF3524 domain-containing protein [Desulfobacteraceae bacterium]
MRGAALQFVKQAQDLSSYDVIFATDLMDLTDFKGLAGPDCPPVVFYFHENQLSYPLAPNEKRDFHLGFTNIVSAAAADAVVFNSCFHRDDFFNAARKLLRKMPDTRPGWLLDDIEAKTCVIYPGIRLPKGRTPGISGSGLDRPLIVWNHRWEYDKNPDLFFRVLGRLKEKGVGFYLALLGEQYDKVPQVFERAKDTFRDEILVAGYQASGEVYREWLSKGRVVVSTAIQENFGIAVMEATAYGCFPLLPDRLSYPELVPERFRRDVIYSSEKMLLEKLTTALTTADGLVPARRALAQNAARFSWEAMIGEYDRLLAETARGKKAGTVKTSSRGNCKV